MAATVAEKAMVLLERAGTAQNCKVYARHGVDSPMFGVSFANLKKIRKELGQNHDAARQLWSSGNHDARILATMLADPQLMGIRDCDAWSRQLDNYILTDAFSGLVGATSHAESRFRKWIESRQEWIAAAGWNICSILAGEEPDSQRANSELEDWQPWLDRIERDIHDAPNRTRHSMNAALISIGLRGPALRAAALEVAQRIGDVQVDHGQTSCQTPNAVEYIRRGSKRKKK